MPRELMRMAQVPLLPPDAAFKDFLDEVVIPILAARFLREQPVRSSEAARADSPTGSGDHEEKDVAAGLAPG